MGCSVSMRIALGSLALALQLLTTPAIGRAAEPATPLFLVFVEDDAAFGDLRAEAVETIRAQLQELNVRIEVAETHSALDMPSRMNAPRPDRVLGAVSLEFTPSEDIRLSILDRRGQSVLVRYVLAVNGEVGLEELGIIVRSSV